LAKKLKKLIEAACGLADLKDDARRERAQSILDSLEWKTKICNELQGLSFRELERTLKGILSEREVREEDATTRAEILSKSGGKSKRVKRGHPEQLLGKSTGRSLEEILAQVYGPREEERSEEEQRCLEDIKSRSRTRG
jgi:hypothetical protein